jgi:hypothetical protein
LIPARMDHVLTPFGNLHIIPGSLGASEARRPEAAFANVLILCEDAFKDVVQGRGCRFVNAWCAPINSTRLKPDYDYISAAWKLPTLTMLYTTSSPRNHLQNFQPLH